MIQPRAKVKWLSQAHTDRNVWFHGVVLAIYPPKDEPPTIANQVCSVDDGTGRKPRHIVMARLMIDG